MTQHRRTPPHPAWPAIREQGWRFWAMFAAAVLLAGLFVGSFAFFHWAALAAAEHDAIYQDHLQER